MGALRAWLLSVTAAAFAVALAQALTPAGTVKKVGRLVGGLVLLLAVTRPLLQLEMSDLALNAAAWQTEPAETGQAVLTAGIAEGTAAYIAQQAGELGLSCTAKVEVEAGPEGWPVPVGAVLTGGGTAAEREGLRAQLSRELGIPPERILFGEDEE